MDIGFLSFFPKWRPIIPPPLTKQGLLFLKVSLLSLFIYLLHLLCLIFFERTSALFFCSFTVWNFWSHNTLVYSYLNLAMYCADLGVNWSWNEFLINFVCWQNAAGTLQTWQFMLLLFRTDWEVVVMELVRCCFNMSHYWFLNCYWFHWKHNMFSKWSVLKGRDI
jgi:hypothetical protein